MSRSVSSNRLYATLRTLFLLQSREVSQSILKGQLDTPDLTHWIDGMVKLVLPLIQEYYAYGMDKTAVKLGIATVGQVALSDRSYMDLMRDVASEGGGRSYTIPIVAKAIKRSTDAVLHRKRTEAGFNPKTIDAINQATIHLCRETIETATMELDSALEAVRTAIKRHLRYSTRYGPRSGTKLQPDGQRLTPEQYTNVLKSIAKSVSKIFNDPYRARRIAVTEFSRAINAGAVLEAKEAPFTTLKVWRSSVGSCKKCKALNGKKRKLDKSFVILPEPGPYSHIMHPPYHPHCECLMDIIPA